MAQHTKMDNPSLSRIVRCLQLRNIHNRATHTRRPDETAVPEVLNLLAATINTLELLPAPDPARSPGAEEGAVEVSSDDFAVVVDFAVDGGSLRPGHARVGDEDVEPAVEFGDDLVDDCVDVGLVGDVELVGFACNFINVLLKCSYICSLIDAYM